MAQASARLKKVRRLKRANTKLRRAIRTVQQDSISHFHLLLVLLAQQGGEATVTRGTIDQVQRNLRTLSYQMVKSAVEGEYVVKMLEGEKEEPVPVTTATIASGAVLPTADPTIIDAEVVPDGQSS